MNKKNSRFFMIIAVGLFLILTNLPFIFALLHPDSNYHFSGFVINPYDGNSYLAKMRQGWMGEWKFHLPFTPDPGEGAYLFLFYIFLGHIAHGLGVPLIWVFHAARILASICLVLVLHRYFATVMEPRVSRYALLLALFGSGLGWLFLPAGLYTSNFWVAEAYPFLSALSNPHFPLSLAIIMWLLLPSPKTAGIPLRQIFGGMLLSMILPFGIVIIVLIYLVWIVIERQERRRKVRELLGLCLGAAPLLGYEAWIINHHPYLSVWNDQNQTPAVPIWDTLISFSPGIWFAIIGGIHAVKAKEKRLYPMMIWGFIGFILVYFPFSLQRRFSMGWMIPVACLGIIGYEKLRTKFPHRKVILFVAIFFMSLPTNILIIFSSMDAIYRHAPSIILRQDEVAGLNWIIDNTPVDSVILASPLTANFIAGNTGRRVVFGHPFETVHADIQKKNVEAFFNREMTRKQVSEFVDANHISYLFYGPREKEYPSDIQHDGWVLVFRSGEVEIFQYRY